MPDIFMMNHLPLEEKFSAENELERWSTHRILLGVSGGADSTALLLLFHHFRECLGLKFYAAHANHQLRGTESDGDAEFTATLCAKLEIPLITRALNISRTADGLENDARRARYDFLSETALELGCRYLALAHHRDDQAETIFHRILRGTGVAGLAGMARWRALIPGEDSAVTLIRPLLPFSRTEILEYLAEKKVSWRTDSTNFCTEMTRNRIRQEVLPQLRSAFNLQLDMALVRLGALAGATQNFLDAQTEFLLKRIVLKRSILKESQEREVLHVRFPEVRDMPFSWEFYRSWDENQSRFFWAEFFRQLWRRERFPEQEMGLSQWTLLADMFLACETAQDEKRSENKKWKPCSENQAETVSVPRAHVFPGGIYVSREADGVKITVN